MCKLDLREFSDHFHKGHLHIVKHLIENMSMNVDELADRRLTPLHLACKEGHYKVVQYLLRNNASTTFRTAQNYNCLEMAILNQKEKIVQKLLEHPLWRQMMRNAQPIDGKEVYDTPMRKLIRYMPDKVVWIIDNKCTVRISEPGCKIPKISYDYEFYEDMCQVNGWYGQGM